MARSCKKTHKRVSGVCVPNNVVHKSLYARIKKKSAEELKEKVNDGEHIQVVI